MKKIFILLLVLSPIIVQASEISGRITTDPRNVSGEGSGQGEDNGNTAPTVESASGGSAPIIRNRNVFPPAAASSGPVVLGAVGFADGGLYRGSRHRVYLIRGANKRLIRNLEELRFHAGEPITDVSDAELSAYPDRDCLSGDLVRSESAPAVYAVEGGRLRHVRSLARLRERFAGVPIRTLPARALLAYPAGESYH